MERSAFAYIRVSGNSQLEGDGFDRQLSTIQEYAFRKNLVIESVFREEAVPGKTEMDGRPAFLEMVEACLVLELRTIIVEDLTRLAREYRVQEHLLTYLASKNISLIAANTQENVTDAIMGDPMRRALVQIQGVLAELDKNLIVSKLMKARKRVRDNGEICEGQPPYGWAKVSPKGEPTKLVPVPAEQEMIAIIRKMSLTGMKSYQIAMDLNSFGEKSRHGKRWHAKSITRILSRPELPQAKDIECRTSEDEKEEKQ